jgi:cyclic beta-1,2-glucan synthetase
LTTWSNDPVADPPSEAIYIRDEETGTVWSPTPLPLRDNSEYLIEHGQGFSRFEHSQQAIRSELLLSIAPHAPLKFACLKLRNDTDQPRILSATYFAEWVLGVARERTQMHVWTSIDEASGALVARNPYHEDVPNQVVFLHVLERPTSVTGDRTEFIGRNRDLSCPAALAHVSLSGTTGAGFDPCGAVQTRVNLAAGEEREVIFLLGQAASSEEMRELLRTHCTPQQVHDAIAETNAFWDRTLGAIEVTTPNPALDALANRWLVYQTLSCRVWGRSAFYQAGGAYGFRDQLQDVMALVYSQPQLAREHILRAASRQFEAGDVQHWWHPPSGRGVRTRFADDYLWLALAASHYVAITADRGVLDEQIAFIQSAPLAPTEEERYELPGVSTVTADLYTHCVRAIEHAFRFGPHGLPLMGCGDWNDGMNKVGVLGQGESVWMAWFLIVVLRRFVPLIEARGDRERIEKYQAQIESLLRAAEQHAWDGSWYRRAYFDDGNPLGSSTNDECRIDSIAQSWSVMAGADPGRTRQAMQSVDEQLVRAEERLLLLFTPPFDKTSLDPGYIKGYLPGIRENGGQYTHAALWVVQAMALQGRGTRAVELFDMLNPLLLTSADEQIETYRGEPYVVAADVYGSQPHVGRAGWTWYTGSAAWMYRVAIESILGIEIRGDRLGIAPCIPATWPGFEVTLRRNGTKWRIVVTNPHGLERGSTFIRFDGRPVPADEVKLVDDGGEHRIDVEIAGT